MVNAVFSIKTAMLNILFVDETELPRIWYFIFIFSVDSIPSLIAIIIHFPFYGRYGIKICELVAAWHIYTFHTTTKMYLHKGIYREEKILYVVHGAKQPKMKRQKSN